MDKKLLKNLPEYLPEFFMALTEQIKEDNKRWGDTWKERGLIDEKGIPQEKRFDHWFDNKYAKWRLHDEPIPWLKVAGEAFICFIREKYMK